MLNNMRDQIFLLLFIMASTLACQENVPSKKEKEAGLREAFSGKFLIGAALNMEQIMGKDKNAAAILDQHMNSIVAENCMKSMYLQPEQGKFFFDEADAFVKFGEQRECFIVGHTLIWHSQAPEWFFVHEDGSDVSRDELIRRMKDHITTVVSRYKGRVHGWDVVNEAIVEDGSFRKSKFYEIIGEDFIKLAFQFAHEADPDAQLYYNDYSMDNEGRRKGVVEMVKKLRAEGVPIDGIGMQGHILMNHPSLAEYEKSIRAYADLGLQVMITELDLSVLPWPKGQVTANISETAEFKAEYNPYIDGLPDEMAARWSSRYLDFFNLLLKHNDMIHRVTFWGVHDGQSWKNDFPVRGRTDYPLAFDRAYNPKPVVRELIELAGTKTGS